MGETKQPGQPPTHNVVVTGVRIPFWQMVELIICAMLAMIPTAILICFIIFGLLMALGALGQILMLFSG